MVDVYVEAARVEDLPPGRGTAVAIEGRELALFNVDGTVYAMDDACLHQGLSLGTSDREGVNTYPVKIEDGKILVAV